MRRALLLYTTWLASLVLCLPAHAESVDQVASALERNRRVYDFAGVLSDSEELRINDRLKALEDSRLAEGAVVLVRDLGGMDVDRFAFTLAQRWKIGRRETDNGFLILVSFSPRKWRIEVGRDLQASLPDAVVDRIARESLIPKLRAGQYAAGIEAVIAGMVDRLERAGGVEALPVNPGSGREASPAAWLSVLLAIATAGLAFLAWPRGGSPGSDPWRLPAAAGGIASVVLAVFAAGDSPLLLLVALPAGAFAVLRLLEGAWTPLSLQRAQKVAAGASAAWIAVAGVAAVVWMLASPSFLILPYLLVAGALGIALRGYFLRTPRACPECAGSLRWLPEREESSVLKSAESLEQSLKSVEYDVWQCRQCNRHAVFTHDRPLSPYLRCPKCQHRTLERRAEVVRPPDGAPATWAKDITECRNPDCGYTDEKKVKLSQGWQDWDHGGVSPGIIFFPTAIGGWGGGEGSASGSSGGIDWGGGIDVGDFGGGGGFDGGGASGDW